MQFLRTLFWVVIAAFVAIIASENWRDVTLDLWGNLQADIKLPVLLIFVFLLGFLPTWLVMRGIRSLSARMRVHSENAMAVAAFLARHDRVAQVFYPGLATHPGHDVSRRQMSAFGGMLSFLVRGDREEALAVTGRTQLFTRATSLGGVESLIEHRASSEGPASKTPPNLLRLSVGLEHPDDLVEDLRQALG